LLLSATGAASEIASVWLAGVPDRRDCGACEPRSSHPPCLCVGCPEMASLGSGAIVAGL
jgi:hypothetical protein